jgi:hypothetical protein
MPDLPGWAGFLDSDGGLNHGLDFLRTEAASQKDLGIPSVCRFVVTAQVAGASRKAEVCNQSVRVGVQGLQNIPALLPGR